MQGPQALVRTSINPISVRIVADAKQRLALRLGFGSIEVDTWLSEPSLLGREAPERRSSWSTISTYITGAEKIEKDAGAGHTDMARDPVVAWKHVPEIISMDERSRLIALGPRPPVEVNRHQYTFSSPHDLLPATAAMGLDKICLPLPVSPPFDKNFSTPDTGRGPTLLIGHESNDVSNATLQAVYLDPLMAILEKNNAGRNVVAGDWVGLYPDDPKAEVQIMIDCVSL